MGNKIYNSYKDLYKGVFEWGQVVYDKSIETGYIESFDGFKLKLPYFEEFKQLETKISSFSKEFWETYRTGKEEYILLKENTEKRKEDKELKKYKIKNKEAYNHYINYKDYVSKYFKRKSEYFRLCLNNPCQAGAASMTKRAVIMLFNKIKENNHLQKVRICSVIYDEVLIEVKEELAEQYRVILEECMVNAGSYFVNNSPITITGTANIGDSWYECK